MKKLWKKSNITGKIPGMVEIKYRDDEGRVIFEWKRNRSGNNVEMGVYELFRFIKEKMSVDLLDYMEETQRNINMQKAHNTHLPERKKEDR
jgi:hypothetical protein